MVLSEAVKALPIPLPRPNPLRAEYGGRIFIHGWSLTGWDGLDGGEIVGLETPVFSI